MSKLFVDPWDMSENAAKNRYEKLARKLNDRMREMEKHGVTTQAVEKYQSLVSDLTDGNKRLPKSIGEDEARTALLRVQDILEMKSSSWKETKEFSLKGMQTFKEKYGIEFESVAQYNKFWSSDAVQKLKSQHGGSGYALQAAYMLNSDNSKLKQLAEDFMDEDGISDDEILSALGFGSQRDIMNAMAERRRHNERRKSRNR